MFVRLLIWGKLRTRAYRGIASVVQRVQNVSSRRSGQLHIPAFFTPGKWAFGDQEIEGRMGPIAGLDVVSKKQNSYRWRESNFVRWTPSQAVYRLSCTCSSSSSLSSSSSSSSSSYSYTSCRCRIITVIASLNIVFTTDRRCENISGFLELLPLLWSLVRAQQWCNVWLVKPLVQNNISTIKKHLRRRSERRVFKSLKVFVLNSLSWVWNHHPPPGPPPLPPLSTAVTLSIAVGASRLFLRVGGDVLRPLNRTRCPVHIAGNLGKR